MEPTDLASRHVTSTLRYHVTTVVARCLHPRDGMKERLCVIDLENPDAVALQRRQKGAVKR